LVCAFFAGTSAVLANGFSIGPDPIPYYVTTNFDVGNGGIVGGSYWVSGNRLIVLGFPFQNESVTVSGTSIPAGGRAISTFDLSRTEPSRDRTIFEGFDLPADGPLISTVAVAEPLRAVALAPDETLVGVAGDLSSSTGDGGPLGTSCQYYAPRPAHGFRYGADGSKLASFVAPEGANAVTVDSDGTILVAGNGLIQRYTSAGDPSGGAIGEGKLSCNIVSLTVDAAHNLYACDHARGQVVEFSAAGTEIRTFKPPGAADWNPDGCAVRPDGTVLAETGGSITEFAPDGTLLSSSLLEGSRYFSGIAGALDLTNGDLALTSDGRVIGPGYGAGSEASVNALNVAPPSIVTYPKQPVYSSYRWPGIPVSGTDAETPHSLLPQVSTDGQVFSDAFLGNDFHMRSFDPTDSTVPLGSKEGSYSFSIRLRDPAFNVSPPVPLTYVYDVTAPVVSITSPKKGTHHSRNVKIAAKATDNLSPINRVQVEITRQKKKKCEWWNAYTHRWKAGGSHCAKLPGYEWSSLSHEGKTWRGPIWRWGPGSYLITARGIDAAGVGENFHRHYTTRRFVIK
jgi:hypothetical protein